MQTATRGSITLEPSLHSCDAAPRVVIQVHRQLQHHWLQQQSSSIARWSEYSLAAAGRRSLLLKGPVAGASGALALFIVNLQDAQQANHRRDGQPDAAVPAAAYLRARPAARFRRQTRHSSPVAAVSHGSLVCSRLRTGSPAQVELVSVQASVPRNSSRPDLDHQA